MVSVDVGQLRATATLDYSDFDKGLDTLSSHIDAFEKTHSNVMSRVQNITQQASHSSGGGGGGGGGGGESPGEQAKSWKSGLDDMASSIRYGSTLAAQFGASSTELSSGLRALAATSDMAGAGIGAIAVAAAVGAASVVKMGADVSDTESKFAAFAKTTTEGAAKVSDSLSSVTKYGITSDQALQGLTGVAPKILATTSGSGLPGAAPGGGLSSKPDLGTYQDLVTAAAQVSKVTGESNSQTQASIADTAVAYKQSYGTIAEYLLKGAEITGTTSETVATEAQRVKKSLGDAAPDIQNFTTLLSEMNQTGSVPGRQQASAVSNMVLGLESPGAAGLLGSMGVQTINSQTGMPVPYEQMYQQFLKQWSNPQTFQNLGMTPVEVAQAIGGPEQYQTYMKVWNEGANGGYGTTATQTAQSPDQKKQSDTAKNALGGWLSAKGAGAGQLWQQATGAIGNSLFNKVTEGTGGDPNVQALWNAGMSPEDQKALQSALQGASGGITTPYTDPSKVINSLTSKYITSGASAAGQNYVAPQIGSVEQHLSTGAVPGTTGGVSTLAPGSIESHLSTGDTGTQPGQVGISNKTTAVRIPTEMGAAATMIQSQTSATTSSKELAAAQMNLANAMLSGNDAAVTKAQSLVQLVQMQDAARQSAYSLAASQQGNAASIPQTGTQILQTQQQFDVMSPKMQQATGQDVGQQISAMQQVITAKQNLDDAFKSGDPGAIQYWQNMVTAAQTGATGASNAAQQTIAAMTGISGAMQGAMTAPTTVTTGANQQLAGIAYQQAQIADKSMSQGQWIPPQDFQQIMALGRQAMPIASAKTVDTAKGQYEAATIANNPILNPQTMTPQERDDKFAATMRGDYNQQPITGAPPTAAANTAQVSGISATFQGTVQAVFNVAGKEVWSGEVGAESSAGLANGAAPVAPGGAP